MSSVKSYIHSNKKWKTSEKWEVTISYFEFWKYIGFTNRRKPACVRIERDFHNTSGWKASV